MNQRKAGIILSYITIIINSIVNLLYVPILLYYMGQNEYGLYQLMGSFIAYFMIMDFGLSSTIVRFYTKFKTLNEITNMENILAFSSLIYGVIALLIISIGSILYFFFNDIFANSMTIIEIFNAKKIYILLLVNILFIFSGNIFTAVITAHEKFVFLKLLTLVQVVLQPLVVIAIIKISPHAFNLALIQSVFNLSLILIKAFYCFKKLNIKIRYHYFDKNLFKEVITFASSIFIVVIVDQIYWYSNQVILGIVAGTAVVAVYAVSAQIYMNYMTLSSVISGVFLPKVTEMVANLESIQNLSNLFIRIGRVQFLLLALVLSGFILFGQEFIELWAGSSFLKAYYIVLIIIIPFTVDLIQTIGQSILQAQNQYGFRAKIHLCMGILDLMLAIPLAIRFDGIGCAFVTGLAILIGDGIIMNIYYAKVIKLNIQEFWKQIFKITIIVGICTFIGTAFKGIMLYSPVINLGIKIILYIALYITMIWMFAMNSYEKSLFIKVIKKMKKA